MSDQKQIQLAIAVVFLVSDENEHLLDLHLRMIEENTNVPYRIYGVCVRLSEHIQKKLETNPRISLLDIPETKARWTPEHSYYLTHLINAAIEDGATHVVTLHVDSFPISPTWVTDLTGRLDDQCVLATVNDTFTACLFFTRSFYLKYRPELTLPKGEQQTPVYQRYDETYGHIAHSGIGYLYKVFTTDGLSWLRLNTTDRKVYGDLVFHFGSTATHDFRRISRTSSDAALSFRMKWVLAKLVKAATRVVPTSMYSRLPRRVRRLRQHTRSAELTHLLDDFDGYLKGLMRKRLEKRVEALEVVSASPDVPAFDGSSGDAPDLETR